MRKSLWMSVLVGLLLSGGCSGSGGSKGAANADGGSDASPSGSSGGNGGMSNSVEVPAVGSEVDTNGDGMPDGTAVDSNGDGVADGVDTNGDGKVDQPLPGASNDGGAGGGSTGLFMLPDGAVPFPVNSSGQVLCGAEVCLCSDGKDNDTDGVIDTADPECSAPWDNDESSLATGIPGDNRDDACQDCFFDGDSGHGNDGCRVASSCITEGNASSGRGGCDTCQAETRCVNFCRAFTPNGCDCFGCCEVHLANGTTANVMLGSACSIDGSKLENCQLCVQNDSCVNECGECELCPGKTVADLPAKCFTAPPGGSTGGTSGSSTGSSGGTTTPPPYTCDNGEQVCGDGLPACPDSYLCQFGCCVVSPILL